MRSAAKSFVSSWSKDEPCTVISDDFREFAKFFSFCDRHKISVFVDLNFLLLLKNLQRWKVSSGSGSEVVAVNVRICEYCISQILVRESSSKREFTAWYSILFQSLLGSEI